MELFLPRQAPLQRLARCARTGRVLSKGKTMERPAKIEIVRRAYELWQKAGEPLGKDDDFYHQAEQELRNENRSSPLRTPDTL
jgi:Protein of unknown function (DUF2934)